MVAVMATSPRGYHAADGERVPSVTTILSRFKESGGLIHWAWRLGTEGKDYREVRDQAADAGTLAHKAVDAWVRGNIPSFEHDDAIVSKRGQRAFEAFCKWAEQSALRVTQSEVRMISENHRFGGTCDAIVIGNRRAICDWKSSAAIYPEYLVQVRAYGHLWTETRDGEPIDGGYHLIRFDKEYGDFHHHFWSELDDAWEAFLALRRLYDIDKILKARAK
jgi:hypothetical protein